MVRRGLVLALLGVLWPVAARAQGGWLDYIEQLSGPGPFKNGPAISLRVSCFDAPADVRDAGSATWERPVAWVLSCSRSDRETLGYLEVRAAWAGTDDQALFQDRPNELVGTTTAHVAELLAMRQFDRAVGVGAGAGWIWFSGSNLDGHPGRLLLTPLSISASPLRLVTTSRWMQAVTVRFEEQWVTKGFVATDFNRISTSTYSSGGELLRSVSILVDVFALKDVIAIK